jgi:SAM-dependent MidA family methyltransferase
LTEALQVWLVETSPALRRRQRETLDGAIPGDRLHFADAVEALPDGPLFAVANEFFDALPIRQFQRAPGGWAERMVGLDGPGLAIGLAPAGPDAELDRRFGAPPEGTIVETCPAGEAVAAALGARGALLLTLDYGDWDGTGDTLQALRGHAPADPLEAPGQADLTAHVGFRWLAEAAPGQRPFFTTQGAFLERLGITERARVLARAGGGDIVAQHRRLTHPDEMGTLFKTLALVPPGMPDPPGFA